MERFWKAALGVAGIGAIGFYVFYRLYHGWLKSVSPNLAHLDPGQTFSLMLVFLILTFLALMAALIAWLMDPSRRPPNDEPMSRLEDRWKDVRYISCDNLVGPDVDKAAEALQTTAQYWRKKYLAKDLILERHGQAFLELFEQLSQCKKKVPGYENEHPPKRCPDFLTAPVRQTYAEMKKLYAKANSRELT
jgi:hypothetical protein